MEIREAAERFARTWEAGWARGEVAAIADLYAEGAMHRSMPFRPEHRGRAGVVDYVRWAFSTERATGVRFGQPVVAGDVAVVEYWATLVEDPGGKPMTIAGCALVRFRSDGLVAEARDYWNLAEGHQQPAGTEFLAAR
jgi:ketosteroid isomerase-like protein